MDLKLDLVLTQIFGFVLFVWIMRRLAWGPVLNVLEARRERIAEEFAAAQRARTEADGARAKYEQELRGIEAKARQRMQEAIVEGQKVAAEMRVQAQAEANRRLDRAVDEIARERDTARELLKEQVAHLSILTAEKILRQKLDDANQRQLVRAFIDEVGALP